jgi:hypothetical protein
MNAPESLRRVGLRRTLSAIRGEPLVHFVVLAAPLFAVYGVIDSRRPPSRQSRRVTVTAGDRFASKAPCGPTEQCLH